MLWFACIFQSKAGFTLPCAICCSRRLLRLLRAHFSFFFFCLCPSLSSRVSRPAVAPANQEVSSPSSRPGCQFSPLSASLRPADCGGAGQPLQANGSCPPPRAGNEQECCLPQTHQAAARKKDHTTHKLQTKTVGNFISWGG